MDSPKALFSPRAASLARLPAAGLAIALSICILAATLMPVGPKNELLSPFPAWLHLDKVGHFLGFALLGAALRLTGRIGAVAAFGAAMLLGALTEALQFLADGRIGRVADVMIDAAGAALGVALVMVLLRLRPGASRAGAAAR